MANLRDVHGVTEFLQLGPGKALANMAKKELERGLWKKDQKYLVSSVATQEDLHRTKALFA